MIRPLCTLGLLLALSFAWAPVSAEEAPASSVRIEKVATGYRFTEGPAVDAKGRVVFSDIPNEKIHRFDPATGKATVLHEKTGRSNGLHFDAKGNLVACEGGRRQVVRHTAKGPVVLAAKYGEKRLNSPNDLTIAKDGGIYFTDPRYGRQDDRELDFEGVYHLSAAGKLTRVASDAKKPNGILLRADGKVLYVADNAKKHIRAYDVGKGGALSGSRLFANLDLEGRGGPDGMARDKAGNIYCAGQGHVWIWDAKGKLVEKVKMPEGPTNCILGAEKTWTLYVTARTSLYRLTRTKAAGK